MLRAFAGGSDLGTAHGSNNWARHKGDAELRVKEEISGGDCMGRFEEEDQTS
jgi:hypothetical protein